MIQTSFFWVVEFQLTGGGGGGISQNLSSLTRPLTFLILIGYEALLPW